MARLLRPPEEGYQEKDVRDGSKVDPIGGLDIALTVTS
jgi:hypothetical protein